MRGTVPVAVVAAVLAFGPAAGPLGAAVVNMPPLTISSFTHEFNGAWARDAISIPGAGNSGPGGTVAFGTGDVVSVRIVPPPGKKFRMNAPPAFATGTFNVNVYWSCAGGSISHFNPYTVVFEDGVGAVPSYGYTLVAANELLVEAWLDGVTHGPLEFAAFRVDITVDQALPRLPRVFGPVQSWAAPSVSASSPTADPAFRAIEIVDDLVVPAVASTWGRLKSLYR